VHRKPGRDTSQFLLLSANDYPPINSLVVHFLPVSGRVYHDKFVLLADFLLVSCMFTPNLREIHLPTETPDQAVMKGSSPFRM
jgi:hypothetical protein